MNLTGHIQQDMILVQQSLPIKDSFDVIGREVDVLGKTGYLVFIDGFAKDAILLKILEDLQDNIINHIEYKSTSELIKKRIGYIEAETFTDISYMQKFVLSGSIALVIDGETEGIIIDAREYPARSPQESDAEKVSRGSHDGMVETIIFNTALVRRRIRDPQLTFQILSVGKCSQTDVVIGYMNNQTDHALLSEIQNRIESIQVNSLVMAEKSLEELIIKKKWYNPLPQVRYTERPDVVAAHLLEGNVVVMVDTSPSAMIIPSTLFSFLQHAEDYNLNPLVGSYYRLLRLFTLLVSLFLTPLWLLAAENADSLPQMFKFIGTKETGVFSLLLQLLLLEFGLDLLKMSSLHIPGFLGSSFGIIGGLLIGDAAMKVGFFVQETVFYIAVTAIASYCIPSLELASAIRIFRLLLLILTGFFGIYGFIVGMLIIFYISFTTETFDKRRRYTWPIAPLDLHALKSLILRRPVKNNK